MRTLFSIFTIVSMLALLAAGPATSQQALPVTVTIIPESDTVKQYEPFYVTLRFTNHGTEDLRISRPRGMMINKLEGDKWGGTMRRPGEMARPQLYVRTPGGLQGLDWEPLPARSELHLELDIVYTWVVSIAGEYRMQVGVGVWTEARDARGVAKQRGGTRSEWVQLKVVPDEQNAKLLDRSFEELQEIVRTRTRPVASGNISWTYYEVVVHGKQDPGAGGVRERQGRAPGFRWPHQTAASMIFEANLSSRLRAKAAMTLAFEQLAYGKQENIEPGQRAAHFAKAIDLMRSTEDPAWKAPPTGGIVARHWAGLLVLYAETGNRPEAEEMLQRLEQRFPKYVEHRPALREWARK